MCEEFIAFIEHARAKGLDLAAAIMMPATAKQIWTEQELISMIASEQIVELENGSWLVHNQRRSHAGGRIVHGQDSPTPKRV